MYNSIALILLLASSLLGQNLTKSAQNGSLFSGTRVSGLHNHWAVPVDGGKVWAWDFYSPTNANCTSGQGFRNIAWYTVSLTSGTETVMSCGGGTAPVAGAKGVVVSVNNSFIDTNTFVPDCPNGWTISAAYIINPGGTVVANENAGFTASQYGMFSFGPVTISYSQGGVGRGNVFQSTTSPITANVWLSNTGSYISAVSTSAKVWFNNGALPGTWTTGAGTAALPAVQGETDFMALNGNDNQAAGTLGFGSIYDHKINDSAQGFIYRSQQRAMQLRGIVLP